MLDFYIIQREDSELYYAGFGSLDRRIAGFREGDLSSMWVSELWHASIVTENYLEDIMNSIEAIERHREVDFTLRAIHISEIDDPDALITDMDTFRIHHREPTVLEEISKLKKDIE